LTYPDQNVLLLKQFGIMNPSLKKQQLNLFECCNIYVEQWMEPGLWIDVLEQQKLLCQLQKSPMLI